MSVGEIDTALSKAALSAAEPVMYVSERQLASCVGTYVPSRKTAEGLFQLALYRAPPAPSVAVKALRQAASDFMHLFIQDGHLTVQGLEDTDLIPAYEKLSAALSAQVQDVAEVSPVDYMRRHDAAIAAYEANTPNDYRYSALALRKAVDAAFAVAAAPAKQEG